MASIEHREFCTVAQAAAALGVHPSTIWRWIDAERLPAYRVGPKSIRIRRSDLEQLVRPAKSEEPAAIVAKAVGPPASTYVPRRLTDEERERALALVDEMRRHTEEMRRRRGGQPLAESWKDINQARDERSRHLLEL
jgi:excisionase family DNA binding protein